MTFCPKLFLGSRISRDETSRKSQYSVKREIMGIKKAKEDDLE